MATLKDLIGSIQYDASWGIWAETVDGRFNPDSPARYSQFDDGGVMDGFDFFADGRQIGDSYTRWKGDFDASDWDEEWSQLVAFYEKEMGAEWDGDWKTIEAWMDSCESDAVHALIEKAREKWDDQCIELSNEWVDGIIEEKNNE